MIDEKKLVELNKKLEAVAWAAVDVLACEDIHVKATDDAMGRVEKLVMALAALETGAGIVRKQQ